MFPHIATFLSLLLPILPPAAATATNPPPLYPNHALPTDSGHLPIDSESSLFYAFYEAEQPLTPPAATPLIVWLQGGPGCSSMFGNLFELGPFLLSDDLRLRRNPFSWGRRSALLFVDSPLGSGFSPAPSASAIPRDLSLVSAHLSAALQSFLAARPPSFRSRPLFLASESYGGKLVPAAAHHILRQNSIFPDALRINLAGVAIGNGLTHPAAQIHSHAAAAYFSGLINGRQRARMEELQGNAAALVRAGKWSEAADARGLALGWLQNVTGLVTLYDIRRKRPYAKAKLAVFLNREEVKVALGAGKETTWVECNDAVRAAMKGEMMRSVKFMVEEAVGSVRVLLYQGMFDLKDGVASTEAWMREMDWEGMGRFRAAERRLWRVDGEIAGYLQKWGNLSHLVVSGAGHFVPVDQGRSSQAMIEDWVMKTGDFEDEEEDVEEKIVTLGKPEIEFME